MAPLKGGVSFLSIPSFRGSIRKRRVYFSQPSQPLHSSHSFFLQSIRFAQSYSSPESFIPRFAKNTDRRWDASRRRADGAVCVSCNKRSRSPSRDRNLRRRVPRLDREEDTRLIVQDGQVRLQPARRFTIRFQGGRE